MTGYGRITFCILGFLFCHSVILLTACGGAPAVEAYAPGPSLAAVPRDPALLPDGRTVLLLPVGPEPGAPVEIHVRNPGDVEGQAARRISFSQGRWADPRVLADGRILVTGFHPKTGVERRFTLHPDGTGLAPFVGDGHEPAPGERVQGHLSMVTEGKPAFLVGIDARLGPADGSESREARLGKRLRVSTFPDGRVLGELQLAADGSWYCKVPADTPLNFELLAADGRVLSRHDTPLWVRANEHRACVGCHEDPTVAPPNRMPAAAQLDPVDLTTPAKANGAVR